MQLKNDRSFLQNGRQRRQSSVLRDIDREETYIYVYIYNSSIPAGSLTNVPFDTTNGTKYLQVEQRCTKVSIIHP